MKRLIKLLVILLVFFAFLYHQNNAIVITEIQYSNVKIPPAFDGLRIVQLSDLHNKSFGQSQKNLIKKIKESKPDIIIITGDFIDSRTPGLKPSMDLIKGIKDIAPIYFAAGNHEGSSSEYEEFKRQMLKENVIILEDESVYLRKDGASINIIGLLDPYFHKKSMYDTINGLNPNKNEFSILLSHRPEHFNIYKESGVDLVFSGHAHGGQFRLPIVGGILSPNQGWFPELSEGLHTENQTSIVVNRGLGNSIFPQRIFNQPEITLVTLISK